MKRTLTATAISTALLSSAPAPAQDLPNSINETPRGPGTERPTQEKTPTDRVRPGWEAGAQIGGGIGVGIGARVGYSLIEGIYVGGSLMHFFGPTVGTLMGPDNESQTTLGADLGYKFFPKPDVELRPFFFMGFGTFNRLNETFRIVDQSTQLTISPAFLAAYHFGNAFVSAETRFQVAPTPVQFALLGGVGVGI
jgi:hypothetical protein